MSGNLLAVTLFTGLESESAITALGFEAAVSILYYATEGVAVLQCRFCKVVQLLSKKHAKWQQWWQQHNNKVSGDEHRSEATPRVPERGRGWFSNP